jgi:hypothetical protein
MKKPLIETAIHEAGHAAMAFVLKHRFKKISIEPDEFSTGRMEPENRISRSRKPNFEQPIILERIDFYNYWRPKIEKKVMIGFAGRIAKRLFKGESIPVEEDDGAEIDYKEALELLKILCPDSIREYAAHASWLLIRTKNILSVDLIWAGVEALAKALVDQKTIGYMKAREIFMEAISKSRHRK